MGRFIVKLIVRIIAVLFICLAVFCGGLVGYSLYDKGEKYPVEEGGGVPLRYTAAEIPFSSTFMLERGVPFVAGAVIDIDNDGKDEIFLGGGTRQADVIFRYEKGTFVDIADEVGLIKQGGGMTTGAAVLDVDGNGFSDLLIARESRLCLYLNEAGSFSQTDIDIAIPQESVLLGPVVTDVNRDGLFDFYAPVVERGSLARILFQDEEKKRPLARLFVNSGDGRFQDHTEDLGLSYPGGALQAGFADLNLDGFQDLVVLNMDGKINVWENHGNMRFMNRPHGLSDVRGDFQGLVIGDYNDDGKVDMVLTNRGSSIPGILIKAAGGYRSLREGKWVAIKNMGDFSLYPDGERRQLREYEFGRGGIFCDCNGDGREDLIVAENHPYWPLHWFKILRASGRFLIQSGDGRFVPAAHDALLENREYGVTPLRGDIDGDGRPDMVWVNLGGKSRVLFNRIEGQDVGFLKIVLPDTVVSLGARIHVKTLSGRTISRLSTVGSELCSDSSHALFLGLGQDKAIDATVLYADGSSDQISGLLNNSTVIFDKYRRGDRAVIQDMALPAHQQGTP